MPLRRRPGRNQKDATSACESVADPPSGEASHLEAPTENSTGLGTSAQETEAASSAWGESSVGPVSLEPTWGEEEVSDEGLLT